MDRAGEPVEDAADDDVDLYEVATWEERTSVDGLAVALHWIGVTGARWLTIVVAALILLTFVTQTALGVVLGDPFLSTMVVLSIVPALALAAYVWHADVTTGEPLTLLVATFLLSVLFANFAAVLNSFGSAAIFAVLGETPIGMAVFFFLIVGPVEETVKWLAIRLYAFRSDRFNAVIDGAVYGAAAGLGFATIENAIYIGRSLEDADLVETPGDSTLALFTVEPGIGVGLGLAIAGVVGLETIGVAGPMAAIRALAGPGHVLYSAIAGYYLGLAKFNPDQAGPIVIKGLLIAAVLHAAYNTGTMIVPPLLALSPLIPDLLAVVIYVIGFLTIVGYVLFRKLARYRRVYREVEAGQRPEEIAARVK